MTIGYMPSPRAGQDVSLPCGGWFDSSVDLLRGLSVIELDEEPPTISGQPAEDE